MIFTHSLKKNSGFGLIEVLITLLVFSVGVLAVAGLQGISKKNNFDALQRTAAANLSASILASMRANATVLEQYLVPTSSPRGSSTLTSPDVDCYQTACTPNELAAFDLYQWEFALDGAAELLVQNNTGAAATALQTGGLASPSACITGPADGASGFYTVIIAWRGVTQLGANQNTTCGADRKLYGSDDAPNSNTYQRFFTLQTYIEKQSP